MSNDTNILELTLVTSSLNNKYCSEKFLISKCRFNGFIHILTYLFLTFALLPQIIHLFYYRTQRIAGISYIWIIIRIFALILLMIVHAFKWSSISIFIAFISTIIIFLQIITFSNNLHRQNKFILIGISLFIWIIGGNIIIFFIKQKNFLMIISYSLLAMHMLPQILLNSLLRTTKSLSKFSILLLVLSDIFLFSNLSINHISFIYLILIYYSSSFSLYIYLQSIIYIDAHIHIISRSAHTVLTPGVDMFTGLDVNGIQSTGQDPQMFSIDELEPMGGLDAIYQPVTTTKSSIPTTEQRPMKTFIWYITLGWIICIEILFTIILIYRIWSIWIIFVPLSIPIILGIFFLLHTKLSVLQTEYLRKIL